MALAERLRERAKGTTSPSIEMRGEVRRLFEGFRSEMMAEIRRVLMEAVGEEGAVQIKGDRGYSPVKGVDFNDGEMGPQGPVGPQGPRGPKGEKGDTPSISKIADLVIKRLEGKKSKIDDVEGLRPMLRALDVKSGMRGGMGNVQHQHEAISSATTTVTTTSKIAGNGYALWVYYNGQFMARGTDYTVGADQKTLTLQFTPQDSTVLDIVYIRTS